MIEATVPTRGELVWAGDLAAEAELRAAGALTVRPAWQGMPPGAALGDALAVLDPAGLSDYDLVEYVKAWERQRRHADGMLATALAVLARREVFDRCAEPDDLCGGKVHGPEGHFSAQEKERGIS